MKLYFSKGACSLVVRIIMNEIGIDSEFESVNLKTKKTESGDDFLAINPKGAVPTLKVKNSEILTENAIILQYLCDTSKATQLLPQIGDFNRYHVLEWLNYIATELHKSMATLFNPSISQELKNEIFIPLIKTKLNYVNRHLQNHQYLLSDQFTLPDAYLFVMLLWTSYFNIDLKEWDNLTQYFDTLHHRESIQHSLKQEGI
jgi:glutathione S-transferase